MIPTSKSYSNFSNNTTTTPPMQSHRRLNAACPSATPVYPSMVTDQIWVWATRQSVNHQSLDLSVMGRWEIYCPLKELDMWWELVSAATESGHLGPASCCGTAVLQWWHPYTGLRTMGVYTDDRHNTNDSVRILNRLRELGINWMVSYQVSRASSEIPYETVWVALPDSTKLQSPTDLGIQIKTNNNDN